VSRRGATTARLGFAVAFGGTTSAERPFYARQVRLGLEELGPTFVKLGQLLSTRSDLVPPSLQHELSLLRDHAPAIPTEAVMAELERNAGASAPDGFASFDITPVACASVAQVHRATIADGRQVAVKIRRPGIRSDIEVDITVLTALTRLVGLSRRMRRYDPAAVVGQFSRMLRAETDYVTEAGNIEAVRRTFADDGVVSIPSVVQDLTSESMLVMDWVEGVPLSDIDALETAGVSRTDMARAIVHAYALMILRSDRFHADPHPGNFIAMRGGRLGMVDFGEIGTISAGTRTALTSLLLAVMSRDGDALGDAVMSMSREYRSVDRAGLGQQLATLLDPIVGAELADIKLGRVLRDLLRVLRSQGLMLPADLAVLVKTLIECEATADELDPRLSISTFLGELGSMA
jgi:ubiquinone biosynthesis protein